MDLNILQISPSILGGGAEKIALDLHESYSMLDISSWLAVGKDSSLRKKNILQIDDKLYKNPWTRFWQNLAAPIESSTYKNWILKKIYNFLAFTIGKPHQVIEDYLGHELFDYPAAWHLLELAPQPIDILHCHNLHGYYFDLNALPYLSKQVPLVLTLHDAWLLSGHCAHSFECDRWLTGCGNCPDLTIPRPVRRDGTAYNWRRKQKIYSQSLLYVTTPSQWLMERVHKSILAKGMVKSRVIPNGIDLNIFRPENQQQKRQELGLPVNQKILLFAANGIRQNVFKDYATMRAAVAAVANQQPNDLLFIALGEEGPPEKIGKAQVQFVPFQSSPSKVAAYYQAADIYLHAAKADTFPTTVLESLACGTPVVATAVGGIPEQIDPGKTGFLVPVGDVESMSSAILTLLTQPNLLSAMRQQAATTAQLKFGLNRMVGNYREWYTEVRQSWVALSP